MLSLNALANPMLLVQLRTLRFNQVETCLSLVGMELNSHQALVRWLTLNCWTAYFSSSVTHQARLRPLVEEGMNR